MRPFSITSAASVSRSSSWLTSAAWVVSSRDPGEQFGGHRGPSGRVSGGVGSVRCVLAGDAARACPRQLFPFRTSVPGVPGAIVRTGNSSAAWGRSCGAERERRGRPRRVAAGARAGEPSGASGGGGGAHEAAARRPRAAGHDHPLHVGRAWRRAPAAPGRRRRCGCSGRRPRRGRRVRRAASDAARRPSDGVAGRARRAQQLGRGEPAAACRRPGVRPSRVRASRGTGRRRRSGRSRGRSGRRRRPGAWPGRCRRRGRPRWWGTSPRSTPAAPSSARSSSVRWVACTTLSRGVSAPSAVEDAGRRGPVRGQAVGVLLRLLREVDVQRHVGGQAGEDRPASRRPARRARSAARRRG